MRLKSEFRRRLIKLDDAITMLLFYDNRDQAEKLGNFFPFLYSVISYLWSFGDKKILKK